MPIYIDLPFELLLNTSLMKPLNVCCLIFSDCIILKIKVLQYYSLLFQIYIIVSLFTSIIIPLSYSVIHSFTQVWKCLTLGGGVWTCLCFSCIIPAEAAGEILPSTFFNYSEQSVELAFSSSHSPLSLPFSGGVRM